MNNSSKQDSINMDLNKEKVNTVMDTGVIINIDKEKLDTEVVVDNGSEAVKIVSQSQDSNKHHNIDSIEKNKKPSNEPSENQSKELRKSKQSEKKCNVEQSKEIPRNNALSIVHQGYPPIRFL